MTGDIVTMAAYIGAGLACMGMGFAAIGVGTIVGAFLKGALAMPHRSGEQNANMFVGIAFAEALGIFAFLVALLLMFAV
jgi:F-type H+-transporting ATPase subunit c|tara:strand:- start:995 stop:1231 length:237 start_codon:yes stop_codon:yes gene_type:complete